jgi:hypothetical protein
LGTLARTGTGSLAEDDRAAIEAVARRYVDARGPVMKLAEIVGRRADGLIADLPDGVEKALREAALSALAAAFDAATASRGSSGVDAGWLDRQLDALSGDLAHRIAVAVSGAAGGSAGIASALAELPLTTTLIFRSIQEIAASYGEDPAEEAVRIECLKVFAQGGPLAEDDETEFGFLTARVGATQLPVAAILAAVAPRFGIVLGEKLAAQAVPVLGAVMGAAFNTAFMTYFQTMAHVRFRLRQMQRDHGVEAVAADFASAVTSLRRAPR